MKNLEIEFKTLLSENDYQKLINHFNIAQFKTQTNYYFDTKKKQLKALGMGLRIRFYETSTELTLKVPEKHGHLEINVPISLSITNFNDKKDYFLNTAISKELTKVNINSSELDCFAKLTTKRAEFEIKEGLLAIDESFYGNQHDYELELEVKDFHQGKQDFKKLLKKHNITYQHAENKIARASKS